MFVNPRNAMDTLYSDLIRECRFVAPSARFSFSIRNRLEKYKKIVRKEIVSRMKDDCAPLFIACKRGNVEIVEYLIVTCDADIEQRGLYAVPEDRSVHSVTPLWCAAVAGKLPVIKCLLQHGADVNAVSDSGSTPVRSACFMTHLDIVEYLIEQGADILRANHNGGTCLINSVQSVDLCTLLLRHGADVNANDIQNKTALHYSIQEHRFATTKLLLDHNADPHIRSRHNDDALQTACLKGAAQIFDYLVENISYSQERLADANELMGTTFFDEHNDTPTALKYWRKATAIRNSNTVNGEPLPKRPKVPKHERFRNAVEFTTLEELEAIALDFDAMRIQSLLICERVLGERHKDNLFRLMYRGASYADSFRYQNCIDLWCRSLEIRVLRGSVLYGDTCFTAQAIVRIMIDLHGEALQNADRNRDKEQPKFSDIVAVFQLLTRHLVPDRELLEKRPVPKRQQDTYDRILKCISHLIYLLVNTAKTSEAQAQARALIHELIKQNPRSASTEDSILHLCVSSLNTINSHFFLADDAQRVFPHLEVIKMLIECGAFVNARNESRSTPLHVASNAFNFSSPVIKMLLEHGAHLDTPNKAGDTPAKLISRHPRNTVNLLPHMSLQCHAARAIVKYDIQCNELPATLRQFLELHRN